MSENKKEISGKVTKVEPRGLHVVLENGEVAFLPKENMHIGKKKKLEEIFSEGFVIRGRVKSKKEGGLILTQKEEKTAQVNKPNAKKETPKKNKKQKNKKEDAPKNKINEQEAKELLKEEQEEKPKQKTLKDLKKLQYIGNMKISVGRGKKANLTELSEEKEEIKELPKVPEGLLENIIKTTEEADVRFSKVKGELNERGLLSTEGVTND